MRGYSNDGTSFAMCLVYDVDFAKCNANREIIIQCGENNTVCSIS